VPNPNKLIRLLRDREFRVVARLFRRWLWSDGSGVGLRRDASTVRVRAPRSAIEIRPLRPEDQPYFTTLVSGGGVYLRMSAAHLLASDLETPYVAVLSDGTPCYMQYLIFPDQNPKLERIFRGTILPLEPDEALLDFAFTLKPHRFLGVMPYAFESLIDVARKQGAQRIVTYVSPADSSMTRFAERIGFKPFVMRRERYRLFRRSVQFQFLPRRTAD
jgi:hypothetical protein